MAHQQIRTPGPLLTALACLTTASTVTLTTGSLTAARAVPRNPIPPTAHNWGYSYGAHQPGSTGSPDGGGTAESPVNSGGGSRSGPGKVPICGVWRMGIQGCSAIPAPGAPAHTPTAPAVMPAQLAATEWQQLPLPAPHVRTAPPRGSDGLVGLAEWFWVANWSARTRRAQAGGVWAEVTARPTSLTISPGSGQPPVSCTGPGSAYDSRRPADGQRSGCSYTYTRSSAGLPGGTYQVTVTVIWGGTWVGSGGTGGTLPALSRSMSFGLRVAEGQAVTGG
jgi:hypothetical protein